MRKSELLDSTFTACRWLVSHSVTQSLSHSVTQSLSHSITQSLSHSVTQSLSHSITQSLNHSVTQSLSHSITQSLSHSITQSLSGLVTQSCSHSVTQSLNHSVTQSLIHSVTHSRSHAVTQSRSHSVLHSDAMPSSAVVPKSLITFLSHSTTHLWFVFAVTWRPAMLLAAFCIPTMSLQTISGTLQQRKGTTDYLRRPRISEFTNCPSVRSWRDGDAEVFVKENTNRQTNKQTFTRCCISAWDHTLYCIDSQEISQLHLCVLCKKVSSFTFRTVTVGASLSACVLTSQHGRLGKYSLTNYCRLQSLQSASYTSTNCG